MTNNLFVTDVPTSATHIGNTNIEALLMHPRVSKITVGPDGSVVVELKADAPVATDDIIRKAEGLHKANKTGFRGVSIRGNKFRADFSEDGVQYCLGVFDTKGEAIAARIKAENGLV
jgi:hypothetical protein